MESLAEGPYVTLWLNTERPIRQPASEYPEALTNQMARTGTATKKEFRMLPYLPLPKLSPHPLPPGR